MSFVVCSLFACHEISFNSNANVTLDDFRKLGDKSLMISVPMLREQMRELSSSKHDTLHYDHFVREYYNGDNPLIWVDRGGVSAMADSFLIYINKVGEIGFDKEKFSFSQIERDIEKIRSFNFPDSQSITKVTARLEHNLTRAYVHYVFGQKYGFIDPRRTFNNLDYSPYDTLHQEYRQLYDIKTERPTHDDFMSIIASVENGDMPQMLKDIESDSPFYKQLKEKLANASGQERKRILANMERCRWRQHKTTDDAEKYIKVNIPSYQLIYVDGKDFSEMKIVCGSRKTKTPMLSSRIMRMDLNPKWVMPSSIVKNDMAPHAGDAEYFSSRNYYIRDKKTGQHVNPEMLSEADIRSGAYSVIQEGGEGNALGRIIFRFPNNFSIYLHDTSTKGTFNNVDRSASHGCIRVERPFDLARFLLKDKDEKLLDKINYSMNVRTHIPEDADADNPEYHIDKSRLVHSLSVEPQIPVLITYQTITMMPDGTMRYYDDVYGYDDVIYQQLKNYR